MSRPNPLKREIDAVLFDAADTLFTTRGSVGEIYGSVARRYGCAAPAAEIQRSFVRHFRHSGPLTTENERQWWRTVVHDVFTEVGMVPDFDRFFDEVYEQFRDGRGWILFPETRDVLEELQRREVPLGVISNFDSRVYSVMRSLDILSFFQSVTISSETGFAKPEPEIFEAAIEAMGVPANRILMVGDNLRDDVIAAQSVGLNAILIDRFDRYANEKDIRRIADLSQVLTLV